MSGASKSDLTGRRRIQFSVRQLLIVTAVVAAGTAGGVKVYHDRVTGRRPMRFNRALQNGDLAEVDRLLRIDPTLAHGRDHGTFSSSHTPLQTAILFANNPKVVGRILEERPDLEETTTGGETALYLAVKQQKTPEVARLIRLGADVNTPSGDGLTPLHYAAMSDRTGRLTKLLLDGGGDPDRLASSRNWFDGMGPLHVAADRNNAAAIRHMLDAGANVNGRDTDGRTALHLAISHNYLDVAKLLVEAGGDLTAKDDAGRIPGERNGGGNFEIAARLWWDQLVRLYDQNKAEKLDDLLDAAPQALSFRTGYSPDTLLHRAVSQRRLDLLDYLLSRGMDVDVRGADGQTPLHDACWPHIPVDFAKHLLDAMADVQARDEHGRTPLHWAARAHDHDVLQLLIDAGADIGARDDAGSTVLDAAFERDFHFSTGQETLALLRQAGHEPTVLYAAATGDLDLLRELTRDDPASLDRGYTYNGVRPLHAAVLGRQLGTVEWLIDQGVEKNPFTPRGATAEPPVDTPLMLAISHNMADMATLLIERGADVNCKSRSGYRPVHAAIAWDRDPKILEALLTHGADLTLMYQDQSAVQIASESKSKHRERYLELLDTLGGDSGPSC